MKKGSTVLRIAGSHMLLLTAAAADQVMKRRVETRFREGEAAILNSHVVIHRSRNSGAAMNMGQDMPDAVKALSLCAAAAGEISLLRAAAAGDSSAELTGMALILGGGAGNMVDRLANGTVTDFIATTFMNFPVFNVADMFVTCGAVLSFLLYVRWEKKREQEEVARV